MRECIPNEGALLGVWPSNIIGLVELTICPNHWSGLGKSCVEFIVVEPIDELILGLGDAVDDIE